MSKRMNLPQLAFAFKKGDLKLEGLPKQVKARIENFAKSVPEDQLKAMAAPSKPFVRQIGPIHSHLRKVKTA